MVHVASGCLLDFPEAEPSQHCRKSIWTELLWSSTYRIKQEGGKPIISDTMLGGRLRRVREVNGGGEETEGRRWEETRRVWAESGD